MKVLFAVNNDKISEAIIKKYQKEYREIISYKNVYYFNAILKELQKDKTYDRLVISEDLEPFANNNYDTIDKFLFDKLDNISDEATDAAGDNTEIILICADRRSKSDEMLSKMFGIGVYSAIVGQDRSVDEVCKLINKPRTKKEAKQYYKIEADNVNYQSENENNVSEAEVQNILAHYKRLGKNEDKYVDSFNNIVSQYTDIQLKIIIRYLPMNVRAVLEERSPKYQELITFSKKAEEPVNRKQDLKNKAEKYKASKINQNENNKVKVDFVEKKLEDSQITKPIVIPGSVNNTGVKKLIEEEPEEMEDFEEVGMDDILSAVELTEEDFNEELKEVSTNKDIDDILSELDEEEDDDDIEISEEIAEEEKPETVQVEPIKKGRGRPKKIVPEGEKQEDKPKRGRGRPKKIEPETELEEEIIEDEVENVGAGLVSTQEEAVNLFDLDEDDDNNVGAGLVPDQEEAVNLFDLDEEDDNNVGAGLVPDQEDGVNLFDLDETPEEDTDTFIPNEIVNTNNVRVSDFAGLLTKDKKVVAFVGTTKNGTSFIVNNVAELLSSMGISVAILDMTKSRNAYYIYTKNEEGLRQTAINSTYKLKSGVADGIKVNKNLTVYTSMPGEEKDYSDATNILATLVKNYSLVLIDCDFNTDIEYFANAQEIFLVQSMDVLTIQPLTGFLRNLKSKNILKQEKIKVVINKEQKVRGLSARTLIGGMAFYNDPGMSYMTELFNKDSVPYCEIPFEAQTYTKYLEGIVNCNINLNGYSKMFMAALKELGNMVYPLLSKKEYSPRGEKYKDNFSNNMNDTLGKMKKKL